MRKALAALALIASPLALATDLGGDGLGGPSLQPRAQSVQLGEPGIANRELSQVDPVFIEAGEPALDFRFAKNKNLTESTTNKSSLITFSRSAAQSPGTYVGADGLIKTAAVNLQVYSEQFDSATWVKLSSTIAANQIAAPDGKQTADKFTLLTNGTGASVIDGFASSAGQSYTASVYAKAGTADNIMLTIVDQGTVSAYCDFDLTNGTIGTPSATTGQTIESIGDGWYRISISYVFPAAGAADTFYIRGGPAALSGENFYLWGAQLEETDAATMQPTAYIHTTSQALAAPRFDHVPTTGDLTTNLLTYSEMFDQWTSSNTSVTANDAAAPDGQQTADKMSNTATSAAQRNQLNITVSSGSNTFSVYAKAGSVDFISMRTSSFDADIYSSFNVASGSVFSQGAGHIATITDAGDGWYRCAVTFSTSSDLVGNLHVYLNADGGSVFDPDLGSSGTSFVYLWGGQAQTGSTLGPYVRTLSETRSISDANAESLGLLVEEARANLAFPSEGYSGWTKNIAGDVLTASAGAAPTGENSGASLVPDTSSAAHVLYRGFSATIGATYTVSYFVKPFGAYTKALVRIGGAGTVAAVFDLNSQSVDDSRGSPTNTFVEDYGNGWYRIGFTFSAGATTVYPNLGAVGDGYSFNGSYEAIFTGDGTSGAYIFGAQLETGSFPTSYIPTVTSQYRYADVAAVQDEDFSTTNLLAYSESFDVGWTATRLRPIVTNATTAPDGLTTADYIEQAAGQTSAGAVYRSVGTLSAIAHTFSAYVKAGEKTYARIQDVAFGTMFAYFNLSTCSVGTTAAISQLISASAEDAGNGWCRISIMFVKSGTFAGGVYLADNDNSATVTDSGGVYLWGASLTATEYPVEYVTTRNLLTDSQDFERGTWAALVAGGAAAPVINNDFGQAPDGTNTADKIDFGDTSDPAKYSLVRNIASNLVIGKIYRASIYAKAATASDVGRKIYFYFESVIHEFTLTSEWQRLEFWNAAGAASRFFIVGARGSNTLQPAFSALVWGAQMEPVPDIVTTATDYVRTVDAVGKSYNWYEPTEGTVFVDGRSPLLASWTNPRFANFNDGGGSNVIETYLTQNSTVSVSAALRVVDAGVTQVLATRTGTNAEQFRKFSSAYKLNNFGVTTEGNAVATDTSGTVPDGIIDLEIGAIGGTNITNGHIKRLTYWPRRQSDSTLQVITQ